MGGAFSPLGEGCKSGRCPSPASGNFRSRAETSALHKCWRRLLTPVHLPRWWVSNPFMHKDEAELGAEVLGSLMISQSAATTRLVVMGPRAHLVSEEYFCSLSDFCPPLLNCLTNALFGHPYSCWIPGNFKDAGRREASSKSSPLWSPCSSIAMNMEMQCTMMPLWMKPRLYRAGFRCGYSSVLVTRMCHTFFQAS